MTKRLQVLLEDDELAEIQRLARDHRQTTAEWVRQALRAARSGTSYHDPEPKLRAVREALRYSYPAGDIRDVLAEIERGYADAHPSNGGGDRRP